MKKTLIISSLRLILIVLMTAVSAADNTTTLTQQNDEIITIENRQINEINDCSAGTDTNSGLEQNFTSESQTLSPKNTDSQSKKLETNFKNNILTATNTNDLLTAKDIHVSGNTFADIQTAIFRHHIFFEQYDINQKSPTSKTPSSRTPVKKE